MTDEKLETTAAAEQEDWGEISFDDLPLEEETPPAGEGDAAGTASEGAPADQPEAPEEDAETEDAREEADEQADRFVLKHLDDTHTVSRDEVITLAQKGMDYDRIRRRLDEQTAEAAGLKSDRAALDARLQLLDELVVDSGFRNADELLDDLQATVLASERGLSKTEALRQLRLDRRERALATREVELSQPRETPTEAAKRAEEKRSADFQEFLQSEYRGEAERIPREVWSIYNRGGMSLLQAFRSYDNRRLKTELGALKQGTENRLRSTGSMSGPASSRTDLFDRYWNDGT